MSKLGCVHMLHYMEMRTQVYTQAYPFLHTSPSSPPSLQTLCGPNDARASRGLFNVLQGQYFKMYAGTHGCKKTK